MNVTQSTGPEHRILSQEQIEAINFYTLDLLERVGVWVQSKEAFDILKDAGCDVRDEKRVKIPRDLVAEAIAAAPEEIEVFNQNGGLAMTLKRNNCYYGTGSDCPTHLDLHSGERRPTTKKDVADLALFCDALPNIDFVMSFGIANDSPKGCNFVQQYEAMLLNTDKPIIVTGHDFKKGYRIREVISSAGSTKRQKELRKAIADLRFQNTLLLKSKRYLKAMYPM